MTGIPTSLPNPGLPQQPGQAATAALAILLADLTETLAKLPQGALIPALVTQILPQPDPQQAAKTPNLPAFLVQIDTPSGPAQVKLPFPLPVGATLEIAVSQSGPQPQWRLLTVDGKPAQQVALTQTAAPPSAPAPAAPVIADAELPRSAAPGIPATFVKAADPALPAGTTVLVRIVSLTPPATPMAAAAPMPGPTAAPAPIAAPTPAAAPTQPSAAPVETQAEPQTAIEPPVTLATPSATIQIATTTPIQIATATPAPVSAISVPLPTAAPSPAQAPSAAPLPTGQPPAPTQAPVSAAATVAPGPIAAPGPIPAPAPIPLPLVAAAPALPAPTAAPLPAAPLPAEIQGQVLPNTNAGQPLINTPIGLLALPLDPQSLPPGTEVTLEIAGKPVPPALGPAFVPPSPLDDSADHALARKLTGVIDSLPEKDGALADAVRDRLPAPGPKLAAQILAVIASSQQSESSPGLARMLGPDVAASLARAAPQAIETLGKHWESLSQPVQGPDGGEWRSLMIPFLIGPQQMTTLKLTTRRRQRGLDPAEREKGTRFLLDLDLSALGKMQFDGLVKRQHKRFDLIVRTIRPLPGDMRRDIDGLFITGLMNFGLQGSVAFQSDGRFTLTTPLNGDGNGIIFA